MNFVPNNVYGTYVCTHVLERAKGAKAGLAAVLETAPPTEGVVVVNAEAAAARERTATASFIV